MSHHQTLERRQEANEFFAVLAHEIRTKILNLLNERTELSYSEILHELEIDDGRLNFHLRKLKGYITPTERGTYTLSPRGVVASQTASRIDRYFSFQNLPNLAARLTHRHQANGLLARRVFAFILDVMMLVFCTGLFMDRNFWLLLASLTDPALFGTAIANLPYQIISNYSNIFFAAFLVFTVLEAYKGQTLGKYVMKIRVEKTGGGKLNLLDAATRNLGKVFLFPLDLSIGILTYGKTGHLRFFDYITGSKTVKVSEHPFSALIEDS